MRAQTKKRGSRAAAKRRKGRPPPGRKKERPRRKKHSRIPAWVAAKDGDLAGALRDLCMDGLLGGGVSFLYPTPEVRAQIVDLAYGPRAEEAVRLLDAHIATAPLPDAASFRAAGSRLGIRLEGAPEGEEVVLAGGARLRAAGDFRPRGGVWEVLSGLVPLEGPPHKPPPPRARARRRRRYYGEGDEAAAAKEEKPPPPPRRGETARARYAAEVEARVDHEMRKDRCRGSYPYLEAAVSLLHFLKMSRPELLRALLPVLDRDPAVSFYLLLEPYKAPGSQGAYLIPDEALFGAGGWGGRMIFRDAPAEFEAFFELLPAEARPAAKPRDGRGGPPVVPLGVGAPRRVRAAIDQARMGIEGVDGRAANRVTLPRAVGAAYQTLLAHNAVCGAAPVVADAALALWAPPAKKRWQDEFRFIFHRRFRDLLASPLYSGEDLRDILGEIRHGRPGNDYAAEAKLTGGGILESDVSPKAAFLLLLRFLNSSDFLYPGPPPKAAVDGDWGEVGTGPFDPLSLEVYNAEASKQAVLGRMRASGVSSGGRLVDPATVAALRLYFQAHGELPPELKAIGDGPPR